MSNYMGLPVKDGKVILENYQIQNVKKITVHKTWKCYCCDNEIISGNKAIKQTCNSARGGGGIHYIYLHPECCIVKLRVEENNCIRFKEITL